MDVKQPLQTDTQASSSVVELAPAQREAHPEAPQVAHPQTAHPHVQHPHVAHHRPTRADAEAIRKAFESGEFPYHTRLSEKFYLEHMAPAASGAAQGAELGQGDGPAHRHDLRGA